MARKMGSSRSRTSTLFYMDNIHGRPRLKPIITSAHGIKAQRTAIIAAFLLAIGTLGFATLDDRPLRESILDGLYLTTATLTTIGFGDIVPERAVSRIFSCALQICGLAIFKNFLANLGEWREVILADHSFKSKLSLGALTLLLTQAAGAVIFVTTEGLPVSDALYMVFTVSGTVGYGDFAPKTDAGKLSFVFFSLLVMAPFGFVVEIVGDTIMGAAFPAPRPTEAAAKEGKSSAEARRPVYKKKASGVGGGGGAGGAGGAGGGGGSGRSGGKTISAGHHGPAEVDGHHRGEEEDATPQGWAMCWGLGQPVCIPSRPARVKRD